MTELSVGVCIFVFNQTLLRVSGNDGVVIYTVISYFAQLILMTMMGINQGTQPLIKLLSRPEKRDFLQLYLQDSSIVRRSLSALAFAIGMIYPDPIVGVYIDRTLDPELFLKEDRSFQTLFAGLYSSGGGDNHYGILYVHRTA